MCQDAIFIQYLSGTSFLSLRGAIATKQSLSEVSQSNYSRLQLRNEIATPDKSGLAMTVWVSLGIESPYLGG
jgi:hypothetical protein